MSVSLEKIDMLMERANISYKEAKDALEMHNGDMVEALIYLEASNKTAKGKPGPGTRPNRNAHHNTKRPENDFFDDVKKFFDKMNKTNFVVGNKTKKILDIPLTVAAILTLITMPVSMFLLILPYLFGYKISILDSEGKNVDFAHFGDEFAKEKTEEKKDEDRMA